jgi:anthranilate phosphoribosyltransferase
MDEISPVGSTLVSRAERGEVSHGRIEHAEFRLPAIASIDALRGAGPEENARIIVEILRGEITDARRDFVLMNAAAGFVVSGLAPTLAQGVEHALAQIISRRAWSVLEAARTA